MAGKMNENDTYELVPVSPIEELRREIEGLKKSSNEVSSDRVAQDMLELIKVNQELVNKLVFINKDVLGKVDTLVQTLQEFLNILRDAASDAARDEKGNVASVDISPLSSKLDQLITQNETVVNQLISLNKQMKEKAPEPAKPTIRSDLPSRTQYSYPPVPQQQFPSQFNKSI